MAQGISSTTAHIPDACISRSTSQASPNDSVLGLVLLPSSGASGSKPSGTRPNSPVATSNVKYPRSRLQNTPPSRSTTLPR